MAQLSERKHQKTKDSINRTPCRTSLGLHRLSITKPIGCITPENDLAIPFVSIFRFWKVPDTDCVGRQSLAGASCLLTQCVDFILRTAARLIQTQACCFFAHGFIHPSSNHTVYSHDLLTLSNIDLSLHSYCIALHYITHGV